MKKLRNRYIFLGIVFFITAIGTLLYPKYISLKAKLIQEFELTVQGASLAFNEAVNRHVDYFNQSLDESFRNLESSLISEAEELDGYLSRMSQGETDVMEKVSNTFKGAYKTHIYPAIVDFEKSYESELTRMEDGLLIRVDHSFSSEIFNNKFFELNQSSLEVTNILRSPKGLIIKVVDDSFEWVPIVGDAWGFLKIAYDPRKENIENKIFEVTEALRSSIDQKLLKYSTLTPSHIENICRGSFNANYAVIYYIYLTYIRR
jgi:hypothetical protein